MIGVLHRGNPTNRPIEELLKCLQECSKVSSALVVLPELFNVRPHRTTDLNTFEHAQLFQQTHAALGRLAADTGVQFIAGLSEVIDGSVYNTSWYFNISTSIRAAIKTVEDHFGGYEIGGKLLEISISSKNGDLRTCICEDFRTPNCFQILDGNLRCDVLAVPAEMSVLGRAYMVGEEVLSPLKGFNIALANTWNERRGVNSFITDKNGKIQASYGAFDNNIIWKEI